MTKQDKAKLVNMARASLLARMTFWEVIDEATLPIEFRGAWNKVVIAGQDLERAVKDMCGMDAYLVESDLI